MLKNYIELNKDKILFCTKVNCYEVKCLRHNLVIWLIQIRVFTPCQRYAEEENILKYVVQDAMTFYIKL